MRSVALAFAAVGFAVILPAQQVDSHSIPPKSHYTRSSFAGKRPLTRPERTNFTETSHYDDVVMFIDSLKKLGAISRPARSQRPSKDASFRMSSRPGR